MSLQVEHHFEVEAPIEQVWDYFADPPRVVPCLSGAELLEVLDETTYRGTVGLRVGPITVQFKGRAEILEINLDEYSMVIRAGGDQQGAPGRAEADIRFSLARRDDTNTEVKIVADVSISGRLAQVGGGMIQSVSKFMFNQFAKCIREAII